MNWAALWAGRHSKAGSFSGSRSGPKRESISRGLVLNLEGARLPKSDWSNSGLAKARFARTDLSHANLTNASLREADLRGAILCGADLLGTLLEGADLRGADLSGALNLTRTQIESAITDETTVLPADLK